MLIAVGEVNLAQVIEDFKLMAADKNERHENNERVEFKHADGWGFVYSENGKLQVIKSMLNISFVITARSTMFLNSSKNSRRSVIQTPNVFFTICCQI